MFYEDAVALRSTAERVASFAIAMLSSMSDAEQFGLTRRLNLYLRCRANSLGCRRKLVKFGSQCSRYIWFPLKGVSSHLWTDVEFFDRSDLLEDPLYLDLTKNVSRNRPTHAHRLIVCALVARDWNLGDHESIQIAEDQITQIQLDITSEAATRRAGQRRGGQKKTTFA
jgi:hypothetical protein